MLQLYNADLPPNRDRMIKSDQLQFYLLDFSLLVGLAFLAFLLDIPLVLIRNKILQKRIVPSYDYNRRTSYNRLRVVKFLALILRGNHSIKPCSCIPLLFLLMQILLQTLWISGPFDCRYFSRRYFSFQKITQAYKEIFSGWSMLRKTVKSGTLWESKVGYSRAIRLVLIYLYQARLQQITR